MLSVPVSEHVPNADQRIVLHEVPWSHYELMLAVRGEAQVPRMAYSCGELELMSPSKDHEHIASRIGRLIEEYAALTDLEVEPYGSWTVRNARRARGIEPDECYIIGPDQGKDLPDLAIEVDWTSGGIEKLEIYLALGVREVWRWKAGCIELHILTGGSYERRSMSELIPGLDPDLIARLVQCPTLKDARRRLREAIGAVREGTT